MRHEIIMPALGMAQKTGLIVAWHKAPGDVVKASDILLDVETDKSTMEVEAGHDGYVAALMAGAGEDVPVGATIAVISSEKPEIAAEPTKVAPTPAAPAKPAPTAVQQAEKPVPPPARTPVAVPASGPGKLLASPKAKRLAAERGIDLGRLAAHGVRQPFHAADLDALPPSPAMAASVTLSEIEARVEPSGLSGMLRLLGDAGVANGRGALWAAFAASSLRAAGKGDKGLSVRVEQGSETLLYHDPDLTPLSRLEAGEDAVEPSLVLRDLTGTCLVSVKLASEPSPVLTLAGDADRMDLRLVFDPSRLAPAEATALVTGFAARLADPLRQLL
ncbi:MULTISPECIES: biotin/lipoyl-containing protein [unclassified Mesorhizobium]|uniref:biotin/lipoyl-containing protein n=1 Tax=unclassified Mesorhizobium TaxID=325217 RepID=UPI00095E4D5B|nr:MULTISPECIES: biotin/lipoyl-containing protein [unclassified Mesorhizobium]MBN9255720.1 hypothetical protein [Mesorhizobium sp.]OJX84131.1 MAG: hypothetical protein BGO93_28250 [Mesorhizobium sp. 65-26]